MNRRDENRTPKPLLALLALLCLCVTLVLLPGTAILPLVAAGLGSALIATAALSSCRPAHVRVVSSACLSGVVKARLNRHKLLTIKDLQWYKETRSNNVWCAAIAGGSAHAIRRRTPERPALPQG